MIRPLKTTRIVRDGDSLGLPRSTFKILRKGEVRWVDGFPKYDKETQIEASGSIQPVTGRDVIQEAQGDRVRKQHKIYTECKICLGDTIVFDCECYEVQSVEDWGGYFKAKMVLKDVTV